MGPVRQNPIQRTVSLFICVCIALCTIVAHNIAQNIPDSFPPYPPDDHHCSDDVYLREGGSTLLQLHNKRKSHFSLFYKLYAIFPSFSNKNAVKIKKQSLNNVKTV